MFFFGGNGMCFGPEYNLFWVEIEHVFLAGIGGCVLGGSETRFWRECNVLSAGMAYVFRGNEMYV